ncbi:hypothetical protein ABE532_13260 [Luteimonas sp. TWI165]|uniref:hypothetical protein n=1 Tax=Luteimonas sp. TWI165 TaxID=3136772 RepID=UPI00320A275C
MLVEECIDTRGEHDPVCAIEALWMRGIAPGFDVAGNQQTLVLDTAHFAFMIFQ